MELRFRRIEVTFTGDSAPSARAIAPSANAIAPTAIAMPPPFTIGADDVEVTVAPASGDEIGGFTWSVANRGDRTARVRSVAAVFGVVASAPLRMLRHGYQSWSPTSVATFGVDDDPSRASDVELLRAAHHADQTRAHPHELRSEWVTALADAAPGSAPVLLGFDGAGGHDGTFRLRVDADRDSSGAAPADAELTVEAFLGDATLAPGARRDVHRVRLDERDDVPVTVKLEQWASAVGAAAGARVAAPFQVGWCSWYHYFGAVTESNLSANLERAGDWPFDVFQLDDGYQRAIGDWLSTNDDFPSSLDAIAGRIAAAGRTPGLWLAPFLLAPDSDTARRHPDWIARRVVAGEDRGPLGTWWNPDWGGGRGGLTYGLDTTHPAALDHLEWVARSLVDAGFRYLKLDFTFSPSADGGYADPSRTPAERVRAGFDAIRRGAGADVFILGCGAPLSHVVGVVDGNRIGPDVAPLWSLPPGAEVVPGYLDVQPSTRGASVATMARSFMHRRLWLNDPDCLMLRRASTELTEEAARGWALTVGLSGGMALVSDDLSLLDRRARALLDDALALGRASDADAIAGRTATCPDLLESAWPRRLRTTRHELEVDPVAGGSTLRTLAP